MNTLSKYLIIFWKWAGLTPEEYKDKRFSNKIYKFHNHKLVGEWEEEFPYFDLFEKAYISSIQANINFSDEKFIEDVVYAIAIDNESERFVDFATKHLNEENFIKIIEKSLDIGLYDSQWQLATRIPKSRIINKTNYLLKYIKFGGNDYVKNRAKYVLEHMNDFV